MGNAYLDKKEQHDKMLIEAGIECGKQQMVDYITCVLRNPLYVKKDIFGSDRIALVIAGLMAYDKKYEKAYSKDREADVAQEHLDAELRECWGDALVPFRERQPDVFQPKYNKKKKGWVD